MVGRSRKPSNDAYRRYALRNSSQNNLATQGDSLTMSSNPPTQSAPPSHSSSSVLSALPTQSASSTESSLSIQSSLPTSQTAFSTSTTSTPPREAVVKMTYMPTQQKVTLDGSPISFVVPDVDWLAPGHIAPQRRRSSMHRGSSERNIIRPPAVVALPPEARDALQPSAEVDLANVKPVGKNGIDLHRSNPLQPSLIMPLDCSFFAVEGWKNLQSEVIATNPRWYAYIGRRIAMLSTNRDRFSIGNAHNRIRLQKVEKLWAQDKQATNLETAFWFACHERVHKPQVFASRDRYLWFENGVEWAAKTAKGQNAMFVFRELKERHLMLPRTRSMVSPGTTTDIDLARLVADVALHDERILRFTQPGDLAGQLAVLSIRNLSSREQKEEVQAHLHQQWEEELRKVEERKALGEAIGGNKRTVEMVLDAEELEVAMATTIWHEDVVPAGAKKLKMTIEGRD